MHIASLPLIAGLSLLLTLPACDTDSDSTARSGATNASGGSLSAGAMGAGQSGGGTDNSGGTSAGTQAGTQANDSDAQADTPDASTAPIDGTAPDSSATDAGTDSGPVVTGPPLCPDTKTCPPTSECPPYQPVAESECQTEGNGRCIYCAGWVAGKFKARVYRCDGEPGSSAGVWEDVGAFSCPAS